MTTYYTNDPSRFGGCFATHDPTVSQVIPVAKTGGGGKKRNRVIRFSDLDARERLEALKEIPVRPFTPIEQVAADIEDDDEILLLAITRILH